MGIEQLGRYRAVCDHCGEAGGLWTTLQESEKHRAIPDGWCSMPLNVWYARINRPRVPGNSVYAIICDDCLDHHVPKTMGQNE